MQIMDNGTVAALLQDIPIPKMFRAAQEFDRTHLSPNEIPGVIEAEMSRPEIAARLKPGMRVAITAGSRGIRNVDIITRAIVDQVKRAGASPFIVPAMGSHGGATAEGQREVLAGYGITEETMGCPLLSSMEAVRIGTSSLGKPVYMDKNAWESDGVIISCRIKPHNAFRGHVESGPCKMMTVGLGKQRGASFVHSDGMDHIAENIPTMAETVIGTGRILFALPCVENAYDETLLLEAILPENILTREPELLQIAFAHMPKLIVGEGDVLIVDRMGKNYSGTGVDPNITGTFSTPYASGGVKVQRTVFLRLTEESHGNALGVGLADVISKRLYDAIDTEKMYPNCITSTVLTSARIPCVMATDKLAIQMALRTCSRVTPEKARVIRIANSLHIGEIWLSERYYEDVVAGKYPGVKAIGGFEDMQFTEDGELV